MRVLGAHTNPGCSYPGYVNLSEQVDGSVVIVVRADPDVTGHCGVTAQTTLSAEAWAELKAHLAGAAE